jgi:hypothetical protein
MLNTGSAHDRCVHGDVMTSAKTIHRTPLVAIEHCLLEARGSR